MALIWKPSIEAKVAGNGGNYIMPQDARAGDVYCFWNHLWKVTSVLSRHGDHSICSLQDKGEITLQEAENYLIGYDDE